MEVVDGEEKKTSYSVNGYVGCTIDLQDRFLEPRILSLQVRMVPEYFAIRSHALL